MLQGISTWWKMDTLFIFLALKCRNQTIQTVGTNDTNQLLFTSLYIQSLTLSDLKTSKQFFLNLKTPRDSLFSFVFPLQDYVLWLGIWEFCFCRPQPQSRHFSNFSRWELAFGPLRELSRLPGGPQPGLPALLMDLERGCFLGPRAGSMPTF